MRGYLRVGARIAAIPHGRMWKITNSSTRARNVLLQ
jgi:hypothetical protein